MKSAFTFRALRHDEWADFEARTKYIPGRQFGGIVACKDGEPVGAVGLDNWSGRTVSVHWWIRHPRCIPALWAELLSYLRQYDYAHLIGTIPSDNVRSLRGALRLGWKELARIKDGWAVGTDIVILEYHNGEQLEAAR